MVKKKESFSHLTLIAIEAALQAGELLRKGFGTRFSVASKKGIHNLVTEYDHLAEEKILDFLRKNVPGSHFLAEESGRVGAKGGEFLWIVDPLDGTVNFAHQIPFFSVSIALEKEGSLHCGVVFQPMLHELFVAEKGRGAFLNGEQLQVSSTKTLEEAFLATGFPYDLDKNPEASITPFTNMLRTGTPIRRMGSAALELAYVAAGRFDAFFEISLAPWDCAAGKVLVEEAGGKVTHWDLSPFELSSYKPILASNGLIQTIASKKLRSL